MNPLSNERIVTQRNVGMPADEITAEAEPNELHALQLNGEASLDDVLSAWNETTARLERTHVALQAEVCRLTDELERKNRELQQQTRLANLGQMAAHVAHEVRNNLMPAALYLSLLRRRLSTDESSRQILDKVSASLTALDATVNDLLSFTAERAPQCRKFAVRDVVDDLLRALAPQLQAQRIDARLHIPADHALWADREMLRKAALNLLLNSLDAMPDGGTLSIASRLDDRQLEVEFADSGPGLAPEALHRAFEPFFTTKSHGTGLGLAAVWRVAELHGGDVVVANRSSGGAAVTLRLPLPAESIGRAA